MFNFREAFTRRCPVTKSPSLRARTGILKPNSQMGKTSTWLLRENRFGRALGLRRKFAMRLQKAHASVPTENRIVVVGDPKAFGLLEQPQCLGDPIVDIVVRSRRRAVVGCFRPPFPRNPRIVSPIVERSEAGNRREGSPKRARLLWNLGPQRPDQAGQGRLVSR